jgi:hypothetical protein
MSRGMPCFTGNSLELVLVAPKPAAPTDPARTIPATGGGRRAEGQRTSPKTPMAHVEPAAPREFGRLARRAFNIMSAIALALAACAASLGARMPSGSPARDRR